MNARRNRQRTTLLCSPLGLLALACLMVSSTLGWSQCGGVCGNQWCDDTKPQCEGWACVCEQCPCGACGDTECEQCVVENCNEDGCGEGLELEDCFCGDYCVNQGGPGCGGSYPCPDPGCTEFGGPHCDCESSCGTAPQCTGSEYCWCAYMNDCPMEGDCGLWCTNSARPGCDSVQRTCECGGADCEDYEETCDHWYCINAANIPPQQGFKPCGGTLTCKDNGCGGTTCPNGTPQGFCEPVCAEGGGYQQPCGQPNDDCNCQYNNCPQQGDCAGPFCTAVPHTCQNRVCGGQNGRGCRGGGCACASKCSTSIAPWDCGGTATLMCLCRGLGHSCHDCSPWFLWGQLCSSAAACPRGVCAH